VSGCVAEKQVCFVLGSLFVVSCVNICAT